MNRPAGSRRPFRILLPYVALWTALAALLAAFAAYEISRSRDHALETARAELESLARLSSGHVRQTLRTGERVLGALARAHERRQGEASLRDLLPTMRDDADERISLFDRDGKFVASSGPANGPQPGFSIADRPYFIAAREAPGHATRIADRVIGRVSGRVIIPVVRSLRAADGSFDGMLMSAVDPSRLVATYGSMRFGGNATVELVRHDGVVYARNGATAWSTARPAGTAGEIAHAWVPAMLLRGDGQRMFRRMSIDGTPMLVAIDPIPGTPLLAIASLAESDALEGHARYAGNLLGLALIALAALTVPFLLVSRRALHDLRHRRDLERRYVQEHRRARSDPLTGVANRVAFDAQLERCNRVLGEEGLPFVLAFIDIDRFKALNDSRGHVAGDNALRRVARTLSSSVRSTDLVARLGGDEFAVLMPGATAQGAPRVCGKLHAALLAAAASADLGIGFSIGVVAFEQAPAEARVITALADRLMYDVKSAGGEGVRYGVYRSDGLHLEEELNA